MQSLASVPFPSECSDNFDISKEHHDGFIAVLLKLPNSATQINHPSTANIFKDLGGAMRKMKEKKPLLQLLDFIVVAAWNTIH